jgi:hypothetical protein
MKRSIYARTHKLSLRDDMTESQSTGAVSMRKKNEERKKKKRILIAQINGTNVSCER